MFTFLTVYKASNNRLSPMFKRTHFIAFALILWLPHILLADWNQDFDEQTSRLIQDVPQLQNHAFFVDYDFFLRARGRLLEDQNLINLLKDIKPLEKKIIVREDLGLIIKKRRENNIRDLYSWELSHLLGSTAYVLPAFPLEIAGKRVIVQKLETFEFGDKEGGGYSPNRLKTVSLETYWKAHLQAYLLGFGDLAAPNVGVNASGMIRFFDNESSLIYFNIPFKEERSFIVGFVSQSFDWPHYRIPLDSHAAKKIKAFVEICLANEPYLRIYMKSRGQSEEAGLLERLDKLRRFSFKQGVCFRDFFGNLYPKLNPGLDKLNQLVSSVWGRPVDHGSALFFACQYMHEVSLSSKQKKDIQKWVAKYID